jgi:hypothetical protein
MFLTEFTGTRFNIVQNVRSLFQIFFPPIKRKADLQVLHY